MSEISRSGFKQQLNATGLVARKFPCAGWLQLIGMAMASVVFGMGPVSAADLGCPVSGSTAIAAGDVTTNYVNCNIQSGATLTNNGAFVNSGNLFNLGTINNQGNLTNIGSIVNGAGATITNSKFFDNASDLENFGNLVNSGELFSSGSIFNDGTILNGNTLNSRFSSISGHGTIRNLDGEVSTGFVTQSLLDIQGGTLHAFGTIQADTTRIAVPASFTFDQNHPVGILGDVELSGTLEVALNAPYLNGTLVQVGIFYFNPGSVIDFTLNFSLTDSAYTFDFLDVTGGLLGLDFADYRIHGDTSGYTSRLDRLCTGNRCVAELSLSAVQPPSGEVPEPGTMLLVVLGLACFYKRSARR